MHPRCSRRLSQRGRWGPLLCSVAAEHGPQHPPAPSCTALVLACCPYGLSASPPEPETPLARASLPWPPCSDREDVSWSPTKPASMQLQATCPALRTRGVILAAQDAGGARGAACPRAAELSVGIWAFPGIWALPVVPGAKGSFPLLLLHGRGPPVFWGGRGGSDAQGCVGVDGSFMKSLDGGFGLSGLVWTGRILDRI